MYLYVEEDSIDFLDKTLNFICCELLVPPSTGVAQAGMLPLQEDLSIINHHATTTTKMPSTIFYQSTTLMTLTTKSRIDTFYRFFQWAYLRPIHFGRIVMRFSSFQQRAKWSFLAVRAFTTDFRGLNTEST
jgi:hypothetical protein